MMVKPTILDRLAFALFILVFLLGPNACTAMTEGEAAMNYNDSGGQDDSEINRGNMPPQKKPWAIGQPSASDTMISGDAAKTVSIETQFVHPGTYTVYFTFTPVDDLTGATTAPVRCNATITWKSGGITTVRRISVVNGTSIQGVGEAVTVLVEDATVTAGLGTVFGKRYRVTVSVAPGARGSYQTPPVFYEKAHGIGPGVTVVFPVPDGIGVKAFMALVGTPGGAPVPEQAIQVLQDDAQGNLMAICDPRSQAYIPLLPAVVAIKVINHGGVTVDISLIWAIDG